jgi:DNA-binding XRE family transcriptional regulator
MESLLDIGKIAQLGNLVETRRRNDLYEQNSLLQAERNRIEAQQAQQAKDSRDLTAFLKLADDPRVKANPQMSDLALTRAWQLGGGPELSPDALQRGRDSMRKHLDGLATGDREVAGDALIELQTTLGPDDANKIVTAVQNVDKISEYSANVEAMRALQGARFEKLHNQQSKINAGELPYSQGVRDFTTLLHGTDNPAFLRISKAAAKITPANGAHPRTVGAALAKDQPEVARFGSQTYEQAAKTAADQAARIADTVGQTEQTLQLVEQGEPLPPHTTKRDLIERVEVGKTMLDAYSTMATWAEDPYNLTKLKDAKTAQALIVKKRTELEALKTSTSEESIAIRREAQTFRETEAGKKHLGEQAQNVGQDAYITFLEGGDAPLTAARKAAAAAKSSTGFLPDSSKFVNPGKKNTLAIDVNDPTTAFRTQAQTKLTGVESTINVIDNLLSTVEQGNIGLAAALKSSAYGFTAQIKGMAEIVGAEALSAKHKNFTPSKWFDPKLTTVDLLANTLAYRIINQEQDGRVSDKDLAEMKGRLNITSLMAGKEDVVQRLKVMKNQLKFEASVYRRTLPTFGKAQGSGAAPSTAAEYLQSIGVGVETP